MKNLTEQEQTDLTHVLMLIGKRVVPTYFFRERKSEYLKWQGNACRQTAMFTAEFLQAQHPRAIVKLYDGNFEDPYHGNHDHAYVFMKFNEEDTTGVLVDVARVSYPCIVDFEYPEVLVTNLTSILSRLAKHTVVQTKATHVHWESMLESPEYYTHKPYWKVYKELIALTEKFLASSKQPILNPVRT